MAIIFHDSVNKAIDSRESARKYMLSFLDTNEPELVQWLHHTWMHQGKAITYKELREMIMSGYLDPATIDAWYQDYSIFVVKYLKPLYEKAMEHAAKPIEDSRVLFRFNPVAEGIKRWTDTTAAQFVTACTNDQVSAIRYVVSRASRLNDMNVDTLARVIRPMVGLNRPQAAANLNYYTKLIENGMSEKKALEASIKYSAKQSRYRGHMIARTELAYAHNKGEHFGVEQAIRAGYMGRTVKVWSSAGDKRVCKICEDLDIRTHANPIPMDGHFNFPTKLKATNPDIDLTPPAHPHCRCCVVYKEISPPEFSSEPQAQTVLPI